MTLNKTNLLLVDKHSSHTHAGADTHARYNNTLACALGVCQCGSDLSCAGCKKNTVSIW